MRRSLLPPIPWDHIPYALAFYAKGNKAMLIYFA
jgi:hypothetical protein